MALMSDGISDERTVSRDPDAGFAEVARRWLWTTLAAHGLASVVLAPVQATLRHVLLLLAEVALDVSD